MANKLEAFLTDKKIDKRRVVVASRQIETLRPEDRAIRLTLHQARKKEDFKRPEGLTKPRSGRRVTETSLDKALASKRLSGATKTRILRAVNRVLEQKKQQPVGLSDLFE